MSIKDMPSVLEDIEKKFYTATVSKIRSTATKGDFKNAFRFIRRAELLDGVKRKLFAEVQKLQIMHGMPHNELDDNPYMETSEWKK